MELFALILGFGVYITAAVIPYPRPKAKKPKDREESGGTILDVGKIRDAL